MCMIGSWAQLPTEIRHCHDLVFRRRIDVGVITSVGRWNVVDDFAIKIQR